MAKQLQLRRGTTSQHGSFTGLVGEVTVDTDKDTAVVHDGSTAGGKPLATEALAAPKASPTFTGTVAIPNISNVETAVAANTLKTGITSGQASAITANTSKVTNVTTDLAITGTNAARTITSSDGTNAVIPVATTSVSGVMSTGIFDAVALNTAKATNVTHTGDVTGSAALTIAVDAVDIAMLSATGSAGATTFLRGDNSWVVPTDTNTTDVASDSSPQLGGNLDVLATLVTTSTSNGHIGFDKGITEKIGTGTCTGTTVTVDLSTGNFFEVDFANLSGDVATFTISNPNSTSNQLNNFVLKVKQHGSSLKDFTWGSLSAIDWPAQEGPEVTQTASRYDVFSFTSYNNGTNWLGAVVGQDYTY